MPLAITDSRFQISDFKSGYSAICNLEFEICNSERSEDSLRPLQITDFRFQISDFKFGYYDM